MEGAGWLEWLCFSMTIAGSFPVSITMNLRCAGINMLLGKAAEVVLPLYTSSSVTSLSSGQGFGHSMSILKTVIKQILAKSASRRIFGIHLTFQFGVC